MKDTLAPRLHAVSANVPRIISTKREYQLLTMAGHTMFASVHRDKVAEFRDKRKAAGVETQLVEVVTTITIAE